MFSGLMEYKRDLAEWPYITYQLGNWLKKLYASSKQSRDEGFNNLVWDYDHDDPKERARASPMQKKF